MLPGIPVVISGFECPSGNNACPSNNDECPSDDNAHARALTLLLTIFIKELAIGDVAR